MTSQYYIGETRQKELQQELNFSSTLQYQSSPKHQRTAWTFLAGLNFYGIKELRGLLSLLKLNLFQDVVMSSIMEKTQSSISLQCYLLGRQILSLSKTFTITSSSLQNPPYIPLYLAWQPFLASNSKFLSKNILLFKLLNIYHQPSQALSFQPLNLQYTFTVRAYNCIPACSNWVTFTRSSLFLIIGHN